MRVWCSGVRSWVIAPAALRTLAADVGDARRRYARRVTTPSSRLARRCALSTVPASRVILRGVVDLSPIEILARLAGRSRRGVPLTLLRGKSGLHGQAAR